MMNPVNAQNLDGAIMTAQERQLAILEIGFRNATEWAIINGSSVTDPNAFDGLVVSVSAANGALEVNLGGTAGLKSDIDVVIATQMTRGMRVTGILSNPLTINYIQGLYYPGINVMAQDVQNDPYRFTTVPTPAGNVDLIPDAAIPVSFTGSGYNFYSDVYLLVEEHNGMPMFYMYYLIPESILPSILFSNGLNCTSTTFGIYAIGALVNAAPVAQSVLKNFGFSAKGSISSTITALSGRVL
jgi:hypothetical protein